MISSIISYQNRARPAKVSFNLAAPAMTSAGVFTPDGTLVRTLWSGEYKEAGIYEHEWDGKDDAGDYVADGSYHVKMLSNNVQYDWEGVIGNTSVNTTGFNRHHWTDRVWDLCIVGTTAYFACGYTEGTSGQNKFPLATPNIPDTVWDTEDKIKHSHLASEKLCGNSTNIYWAGYDPNALNITAVFATAVSDDAEVTFSSGVPYASTYGRTFPSVIDKVDDATNNPKITGMAVQESGDYLFVARAVTNSIHVLNKTTGALVQSLTMTAPRHMCMGGTDTTLWIISGTNTVAKYTINSDGTLTSAILTLSGLVAPVSVSMVYDNSGVVVADGSTSQQYKAFNNNTGAADWTYGQAGGYVNSPSVTNDKFCFKTAKPPNDPSAYDNIEVAFMAFQSDGSVWISDSGNQRLIRMNAAGTTKLDEIINVGYHYSAHVDANDPTRVFANYMEFSVNYGTGAWALVKNWIGNVNLATKDNQFFRLRYVTTLSNERTYAMTRIPAGECEIVELSSTGLRYTGVTFPTLEYVLQRNGDIVFLIDQGLTEQAIWKRKTLTGFDGSHNPQYSADATIGTTPALTIYDPLSDSGNMYANQITSSDIIIAFSPDAPSGGYLRGSGYHLGGVSIGETEWLWKASPATHTQYEGPFPANGDFDIGNGVEYAGSYATTLGRHIVYGYHGESWKDTQVNKWNHFYDNGLFIGQFGITGPEAERIGSRAVPEMAGNAIALNLCQVGSDYYLWHSDESVHGGPHRWKISGLNTLQEHTIQFIKSGAPYVAPADYVNLMEDLTFNSVVANNTAGWTRNPTTEINDPYVDEWRVLTSRHTYKAGEMDVFIRNFPGSAGLTRWVKRDLGTNTGLSSWGITGEIAYTLGGETSYNHFEILDSAGRVIIRVSNPALTYPNMSITANETTIATGDIGHIVADPQTFIISVTGSSIEVSYADYTPVTETIFDALADISNPTTLKIEMYSADTSGHEIDIANLKFYTE